MSEKVLQVLQQSEERGKALHYGDLLRYCKLVKEEGLRTSRTLHHYGSLLLKRYFSSIPSNEVWELVEQIFIASLDCGELQSAEEYLSWFTKKFGSSSSRVQRLSGMFQEGKGNTSDALRIYTELLKKDETDSFVMKRKIAIHIGKGDTKLAIELLNEYLTVFMSDTEAWGELAELYLKESKYENALFCFEELILAEPYNYHYYTKLAEILYTIGGEDNLEKALKYYSTSIELSQQQNVAALYGVILTVSSMKPSSVSKEANTIAEWAKQEIKKQYRSASVSDDKIAIVESSLDELSITEKKVTSSSPPEQTTEKKTATASDKKLPTTTSVDAKQRTKKKKKV